MTETVEGFRLSRQQQRFWRALAAGAAARAHCLISVRGPVDVQRLRAAVTRTLLRHEALRTAIRQPSGLAEPLQVVLPVGVALSWSADARLDLEHGPVVRAVLREHSADDQEVAIETFAGNADATSLSLLAREIAREYGGSAGHADEPIRYVQFAQWQEEIREDPDAATGRELWAGLPHTGRAAPRLPYELTAPPPDAADGYREQLVALPPALATAPGAAGTDREHDVDLLLLASWVGLLARLSGQADLSVALLLDGRSLPELADAIGAYAEPAALSVTVRPDTSVADLLAQVAGTVAGYRRHQERLWLDETAPDPIAAISFEVLHLSEAEVSAGVRFAVTELAANTTSARLALVVERGPTGLRLRLRYHAPSFWPGTGEALADQLSAVLACAVADEGRPVLGADLFTERTRRVLDKVNETDRGEGAPASFLELFADQVVRHRDRVAVVDGDRHLTYAQLDGRAGQLDRYLRGRGITEGALVALCLEPSHDMAVGVVGVMRSGAAWLPVDPQWPVARIRRILREARPDLVITHESLLPGTSTGSPPVLCLDRDAADLSGLPAATSSAPPDPDALAYVMYTSGSTGVPKGVSVTHRGLGNYLAWCREAYAISPDTGALVHSSLSFDLTITSLLGPLVGGGATRFAGAAGIEGLVRGVTGPDGVDLLKLTPAHLRLLGQMADQQMADQTHARPARTIVVGGEALTEEIIGPWRKLAPDAVRINEYGPTETVVGCCVYRDERPLGREAVPIGRPIANTRLYLLDEGGRRVGIGIPGEIYIGGAGVARGYHRQAGLTAERFVPDPFTIGGRLYRTGDIARFLPTGDVEYLGRNDDQVQIQGARVELGEVESVLGRHPDVAGCAAAVHGDPAVLHGYVVVVPGATADPAELRGFLANRVPASAVPAVITLLSELPLTPNGKVDRRRLPASTPGADAGARPVRARLAESYQAPGGAVEEAIARIWAEILGLDQVGVHDNFFDLGGHSLLLIELAARLQREFGSAATVLTVVEHPTVATLAMALGGQPADPPIDADESSERARRQKEALIRRRQRREENR